MMKRMAKGKRTALLALVICAAVFLSACSPRLVGEAKAKEAGLAMEITSVYLCNQEY